MKKFRADLKYHLLAIDGVCENEPDRYQGLLKRLEKDLRGAAAWGYLGGSLKVQGLLLSCGGR